MRAWWGKKSSKSKEQQYPDGESPKLSKSSIRNDIKREKDKPKSFDEVFASRYSPRNSKDFSGGGSGSSGFSGFGSDRGFPLPRPSLGTDHGAGLGSGSGSVSSESSSGSSSDDHVHLDQVQFGNFSNRGHGDTKLGPMPRSPGPGSRSSTTATSPRHPRFCGTNLDSPNGKQEEGKGEYHRLPLPPGSPTSPSSLPNTRTCIANENTNPNLSKWKRGRLLGRGTFGHVYLGFNSESGQMCAIKEVREITDDQASKESLKQLNQEIALLSQLSHPNIVQYYGSEMGEEKLSVYLEYVSGGSIHKLLQEYGAFREPVIQNYTRQILSGLAYLHGRSTVHRDIKGANILVDPNGEIKLADFGMAKHIAACSSMLSFKGSPYWMAPEVVMNSNGYSLPVDIWSLGCTILEMATSKPPWSQYEGVAAIFKIGNSKDIPAIPDHLSNDAKCFVKLCLQRDPSARPTALQLLDHPFVQDQGTARVGNFSLTNEVFSNTLDGSRTPTALELRHKRTILSSGDGGHVTKPVVVTSRPLMSPRDGARMITSLPVSPCSSPLRQFGPAYKSCFLSPPHPSFALVGQSGYNLNDNSIYQTRPTAKFSLDPWRAIPQFQAQTPDVSPRRRHI
ncbi:LOW QUALITY PROTEIN: mitogen-activated protein kinase kinase kinase 3-like [Actinidia eriantha]|uniref:LOW QUALITY PROTEIN: mitogen-activated protein kinase kinase kinase 3-like n=1 Tax=Actinidia eriantha TaxID=165200 RepID=UPI0025874F19|nr:LOW QUALITY PROTEIN: mitogen-activated protein kinase kinase kinase 3-like [Actinidia eriantha]